VLRLAALLEEVLRDVEKLAAIDVFIGLFQHLSHDRGCSRFARLDPSTRQRPNRIALEAVQQHMVVIDDHGSGPKMESVTAYVEGDHAL